MTGKHSKLAPHGCEEGIGMLSLGPRQKADLPCELYSTNLSWLIQLLVPDPRVRYNVRVKVSKVRDRVGVTVSGKAEFCNVQHSTVCC